MACENCAWDTPNPNTHTKHTPRTPTTPHHRPHHRHHMHSHTQHNSTQHHTEKDDRKREQRKRDKGKTSEGRRERRRCVVRVVNVVWRVCTSTCFDVFFHVTAVVPLTFHTTTSPKLFCFSLQFQALFHMLSDVNMWNKCLKLQRKAKNGHVVEGQRIFL